MVFAHHLVKPPQFPETATLRKLEIQVHSDNQPLAGALVFLVARNKASSGLHEHQCIANTQGTGFFSYCPEVETPLYVSAVSPAGTWYGASQHFEGLITLDCPPLEFAGPLDWWHNAVGIKNYDPTLGQGMNVGLIDTGVGPHPYLKHVTDLGAIVDGAHTPNGTDVSYHGTSMAGLIAARPTDKKHPAGIAPGVNLNSLRVYGKNAEGAEATDVADAIVFLATKAGADLINLSLSSDTVSTSQSAAIKQARAAGALCIAAAGNGSASPVGYPAATPGVVAVGALGHNAPGPVPDTNRVFEPTLSAMKGKDGMYLCSVSSYGDQLSCLAPGTAIAVTVPSPTGAPLYASQVGSSNAAAIVTGVLAAVLSRDAEYQALPRNEHRANYAEETLQKICTPLGMRPEFQGHGMPFIHS